MRVKWPAAFAALALVPLGACATTVTRVDCGDMDVVMTEKQRDEIQAKTGENHFASDVCDVANKLNPEPYEDKKKVTITMPSGDSYDVTLQASP